MISVPKVVAVLSCGLMLCLGLSHTAEAYNAVVADEVKADSVGPAQGRQVSGETQKYTMEGGMSQGRTTIKSEALRVEGTNCFVQGREGKEGRLRIDETTPRARNTSFGNRETTISESEVAPSSDCVTVPTASEILS